MRQFLALLIAATCSAADWTCGSGVQKHEKILSVASVSKLQLVLKLKLSNAPLSAPVMVGGLVTAKGIKDLVFVSSGSDVYAVDSDLGTLLWQRRLATRGDVAPVLGPVADNDDDDYLFFEVRPLFLLQVGGKVVTLNAGAGTDIPTPTEIPHCDSPRVNGAVANGVRFELANTRTKPVLRAFDVLSGNELFNSGNQIEAPVDSSGLAIANGHVCFGDKAGTLYCFGFPIDL
jgi:outer membrane protein assembly factor BamB